MLSKPFKNEPNNLPKTALITGASQRLGAAMARFLAEHKINIAVHYSSSSKEANALCDELISYGVKAKALKADLTKTDQVSDLFESAKSHFGEIDLLINNASVFEDDGITKPQEAPLEEFWDTHFNLHVKAPSILSAKMAEQKSLKEGLIVNIIDQRVWNLNPSFYSYTLSKSALWTATKTMAQSLAPKIRVNAIAPGPTLANKRQSEADFKKQVDGLLLGKGPQLTEFGETILYFWRIKSLTGQMLALDGGQHLSWETPDIAGIKE